MLARIKLKDPGGGGGGDGVPPGPFIGARTPSPLSLLSPYEQTRSLELTALLKLTFPAQRNCATEHEKGSTSAR